MVSQQVFGFDMQLEAKLLKLMISSKQMTAAWFETGTVMQHSGSGSFGK